MKNVLFKSMAIAVIAAMVISCGSKSEQKTDETSDEAATAAASGTPGEKKLPFERGSYVEVSNALGMEVKKTVYFDHWGDWTATEDKSEMTIMGYTSKTHKLEIVKGATHWDIDLIEKTGRTYELNIPAGMAAALGAALGGEMMKGMEITDLGEEDYLGYTCKKSKVKYTEMNMEVTTLSYGNLTMKMEGNMGGMNTSSYIASIDLSAPPASIFEIPEGIEIVKEQFE